MNRETRCLVLDDDGVRGRDSHVDAWQRVDRSTGAIRRSAEVRFGAARVNRGLQGVWRC